MDDGPARSCLAVPAGVIAVVRAATAGQVRTIVRGLVLAAVPAVELTMTVPGAAEIIAEVDAVAAHARRVLDEITEADGHADDH